MLSLSLPILPADDAQMTFFNYVEILKQGKNFVSYSLARL